ncbi:methylmalonyl Co-A mutase-associated GTPase MeaB [Neobacillus novalis]|uniref:Methylmalonyl Co-A mutase-associated GTPase MeaB n=1 Tax=Neobacillus novalis TaxID=220687 RepID=A0AA95S8P5_9BACI|nr:methylmalonyl Co-A mutase-associated GTPase MeaB [Neobacillus novalis]WHY83922.1 methylmalonyl Co-A mutase-associated GTPase MeaB [Neobacillus novalis]
MVSLSDELIEKFDQKDEVVLGKLLKEVENQTELGFELLKHKAFQKGKAHIVGITGPPGSGKSTLVGKICKSLAQKGLKIGVVCIDPTSPFTKGALLGDRVRMQELAKYPNIFIKSLATRGNLGGLAGSTADVVQVLDAFDKDIILLETVGVGQAEFDVLDISDTVVLVNVPGLGDSLQTLKAGIMEIADLYVINQSDRPGADESVKDLRMMVNESKKEDWKPPILKTIATQQEGVEELIDQIHRHKSFLRNSGQWAKIRQNRHMKRLRGVTNSYITEIVENTMRNDPLIQKRIEEVKRGEIDPFTVSNEIIRHLFQKQLTL